MKSILLTRGQVALVDDEDFDRLSRYKWCTMKVRNTWYAVRTVRKDGKRTSLLMHREILKPPAGMETDHKDGNGLNNQRYNLRAATKAQNLQNGRKRKGTTSRYKGVCWCRRDAKWHAQIQVEGKQFYLGYFLSEMDAAQAYDAAAIRYFGEFACTNFPRGDYE